MKYQQAVGRTKRLIACQIEFENSADFRAFKRLADIGGPEKYGRLGDGCWIMPTNPDKQEFYQAVKNFGGKVSEQ